MRGKTKRNYRYYNLQLSLIFPFPLLRTMMHTNIGFNFSLVCIPVWLLLMTSCPAMVNATPEPLVPVSFTGSPYSTNMLYDWSCGQIGDLNLLSDPLTANCRLAATFSSFKSCHCISLTQRIAYSCFALKRHLYSSEFDLLTLNLDLLLLFVL